MSFRENWSDTSFLQYLIIHPFLIWRSDLLLKLLCKRRRNTKSLQFGKNCETEMYNISKIQTIHHRNVEVHIEVKNRFFILKVDRTISQSDLMNDEQTWTFCTREWTAPFLRDVKRIGLHHFMCGFFVSRAAITAMLGSFKCSLRECMDWQGAQ